MMLGAINEIDWLGDLQLDIEYNKNGLNTKKDT